MDEVFFTYVWGGFGQRGSPLTFAQKADRTSAMRKSSVGDFVFGVVSRSPSDPSVQISENRKGRVLNVWQISHDTADTADFGVSGENAWEVNKEGLYRWPHALQPIRTWILRNPPLFRDLSGYSNTTHTQAAITTLQKVDERLAETLMELVVSHGEELDVLTPRFQSMSGKLATLQQKHPFAKKGYSVPARDDTINSVYIGTLGHGSRDLKIGHSQDASARVKSFNAYRLSSEPQWILHTDQPIGTVEQAISAEAYLGRVFAAHRTDTNNSEIFRDLDPMDVLTKLATFKTGDVGRED